MPNIRFDPADKAGTFESGTSLLAAATNLDVGLRHPCGGSQTCGRCKVVIQEGTDNLAPLTDIERTLLSTKEREQGYRLACATVLEDGSTSVFIPEVSRVHNQVVLEGGQRVEHQKSPAATDYVVEVPVPTLDQPVGDFERIQDALNQQYGLAIDDIDYRAQQSLPEVLREANGAEGDETTRMVATVWQDREVLGVSSEQKNDRYGLAVDVGTTTIVGYLLDMRTGDVEAIASAMNPQARFGEDLISRIQAAEDDDDREELQSLVIQAVNDLAKDTCDEAGISPGRIYETVLVGNTAMHHLFLGISPKHVAKSPYPPARHSSMSVKARDLDLVANPVGYARWLPINAGWVGADNVAVLLATRPDERSGSTLVIDIGTNGEIVLGARERMIACSTAAGPALEGGQIEFGMRAAPGSIEYVSIDSHTLEPEYETIGDEPPVGICGSGIVDAVAAMLTAGIINRSGQFALDGKPTWRLRRRDRSTEGVPEYVLAGASESGIGDDITITQHDIREVQRAKGALQAGARLLMDNLDIEEPDRVLFAGAFGNYIDKRSALTIGLYPECPLENVEMIGNAAGIGAQLALLSEDQMQLAEQLAARVEYLEIAGTSRFQEEYVSAMQFPHTDDTRYPYTVERFYEGRSDST